MAGGSSHAEQTPLRWINLLPGRFLCGAWTSRTKISHPIDPYVDFAFALFNASLVPVEVKAKEAGGYVKFSNPLARRLEILADEIVESRRHGRIKARQWLSREDDLRQVELLTSPAGIRLEETLTFPGLPPGPSFDFDFSEMRIQVVAGDSECPLSFWAASASYYLSTTALQKIKQRLKHGHTDRL